MTTLTEAVAHLKRVADANDKLANWHSDPANSPNARLARSLRIVLSHVETEAAPEAVNA